MPPSQSYDHALKLDSTFVPKVSKLYPLFPQEQKVTEEFLEEHLFTWGRGPVPGKHKSC